jgi:hypothetical protein
MTLRDRTYRLLNWLLVKFYSLKQTMDCWDYGKNVHGGPAPVDWRIREGLPTWQAWLTKDRWSGNRLIVGKVKQTSVWVEDKRKGKGLGVYVPTPEVDSAWGDDSWIHAGEDEQ